MSIVSHLHQLFNAEPVNPISYGAVERSVTPVPPVSKLQRRSMGTYHYQPGLKRYRCKEKDCKRTFNDLTGTLLDGSKRS